jgi:hypothetical protein
MKEKDLISNASKNIADRLTWCTSNRDQAGITKDLADGKDIQEIYGLGEASLFDEFFYFLDEIGVTKLFGILDPKTIKRESNINFYVVILIYLMRIVSGLAFFWHTGPVILRSQSLMRLAGFDGRQIRIGTSGRGVKKTSAITLDEKDAEDDGSKPIRGPIYAGSIATYIEAIMAHALESFLNGVIEILASHGFFPKEVHALVDASEIQTTESCKGCGKVSKEKAPELRNRKKRIRKIIETVFGFKIWVVWDPTSRIPIAIRFATIEVPDIQLAKEVVQQAIINLGEHARIASLAFDRGFIDGIFMWWLNKKGIEFYVPAKKNMKVYEDALSMVGMGITQTREKKRSVGYGKEKHVVIDHWEVEGIEGLTSAGFYGESGSGSHENSKGFIPNPINAVAVLHDPFKENNPNSDTMVILTNAAIGKPLKAYDRYDERSEIENSLFREAKQSWFIERPAKNTGPAFRAHVYLTIITMALTTAFRCWMDDTDDMESQGVETGIRKFREKVRQENGNKLIIFDEDRYAILDAYEIVILCNRNVAKPRGVPERITKEDILRKYCVSRE